MTPDSSRTSDLPSSRRPTLTWSSASLSLSIASRSDTGQEREHNEDRLLVASVGAEERSLPGGDRLEIEPPGFALFAVCDGMGGANAGEVASRMAASIVEETMIMGGPALERDELGRRLIQSLTAASARIHAAGSGHGAHSGMGTTATVCALRDSSLFVAQVGDSRAYLLRRGRLTQLTRDQTLATLMMENGQLAPEELASFAFGHVILQAVGTQPSVEVDLRRVTVASGDTLLVCSDGLHGPVSDEEIQRALELYDSPDLACAALIQLANEAGGPDNVSCIVARIGGGALPLPSSEVEVERAVLEPEEPAPFTERSQHQGSEEAREEEGEEQGEEPAKPRSAIRRLLALFSR